MSDKEALQELQCGPVFLFEGGGSAGRLLGFLVTSRRQKSFPQVPGLQSPAYRFMPMV